MEILKSMLKKLVILILAALAIFTTYISVCLFSANSKKEPVSVLGKYYYINTDNSFYSVKKTAASYLKTGDTILCKLFSDNSPKTTLTELTSITKQNGQYQLNVKTPDGTAYMLNSNDFYGEAVITKNVWYLALLKLVVKTPFIAYGATLVFYIVLVVTVILTSGRRKEIRMIEEEAEDALFKLERRRQGLQNAATEPERESEPNKAAPQQKPAAQRQQQPREVSEPRRQTPQANPLEEQNSAQQYNIGTDVNTEHLLSQDEMEKELLLKRSNIQNMDAFVLTDELTLSEIPSFYLRDTKRDIAQENKPPEIPPYGNKGQGRGPDVRQYSRQQRKPQQNTESRTSPVPKTFTVNPNEPVTRQRGQEIPKDIAQAKTYSELISTLLPPNGKPPYDKQREQELMRQRHAKRAAQQRAQQQNPQQEHENADEVFNILDDILKDKK